MIFWSNKIITNASRERLYATQILILILLTLFTLPNKNVVPFFETNTLFFISDTAHLDALPISDMGPAKTKGKVRLLAE
jgi:hypothetical protein